MPKYLSGRVKRTPQDELSVDRYRYLALDQAEPNLGDPPSGGSSGIPAGDQYQIISILGDDNTQNRYWVPVQGGLIPGAITVLEEGTIVGSASSITRLNFVGVGVGVTAVPLGIAATVTIVPPGDVGSVLFKESVFDPKADNFDGEWRDDFSTSSDLVFNSSVGILTVGGGLNLGIGGTILTAYSHLGISSIGIGTTVPTQSLHVQGDFRLTGTIYDFNEDGGNQNDILTKGTTGVEWVSNNAVRSGAGGTIYDIQYHNTSGLVDGAENFVWNATSKRVGIGSTQPTQLLDLLGYARFIGQTEVEFLNVGVGTIASVDINGGDIEVLNVDTTYLNVTGIGTVFSFNSTDVSVSGVATIGVLEIAGASNNTIKSTTGNIVIDSSAGTTQINDVLFINDSTESTSCTTGALRVSGGGGLGGNLNVCGQLNVLGITTLGSSGGVTTTGGDLYVGGDLFINDDIVFDEVAGRVGNFTQALNTHDLYVTGIATFKDDVQFHGNGGITSVRWDKTQDSLEFVDGATLTLGSNRDLLLNHTMDLSGDVDYNGDNILDGGDWCSLIKENGAGPLIFKTNGGPGTGAYQFYDVSWRPILKLFSGTNARVGLYHAALERLVTTSTGINITGISEDDGAIHNGDVKFYGALGVTSVTWDQSDNALEFLDNSKLVFGASDDFSLYHDGANNFIDFKTNNLYIRGNTLVDVGSDIHLQANSGEDSLVCWDDEGVSIFYNGDQKFITALDGIEVTGVTSTTSLNVLGIATFKGALHDKDGEPGNAGEFLQSTGSQVDWVSPTDVTVQNANRVGVGSTNVTETYYPTFVDSNNPYNSRSNENLFSDNVLVYKFDSSTSNGKLGIGTNNPSDRVTDANTGVIAAGIGTFDHVYANKITTEEGGTFTYRSQFTGSAGVSVGIDTFSHTDYDAAEYTLYLSYSTHIQSQKALVMDNGTNAYCQEYGVMYEPQQIVSVGATITGSNVVVSVTPETGVSGTISYKYVRHLLS